MPTPLPSALLPPQTPVCWGAAVEGAQELLSVVQFGFVMTHRQQQI